MSTKTSPRIEATPDIEQQVCNDNTLNVPLKSCDFGSNNDGARGNDKQKSSTKHDLCSVVNKLCLDSKMNVLLLSIPFAVAGLIIFA